MDLFEIVSLLPAGWIIGMIYTMIDAWDDIAKCVTSCNSYALKAEKLLIVAVIFMGAASPSQVVYSHLKSLIDKILIQFTGSPLTDNTSAAHTMKTIFMFLGVRGLDEIWDYVRHSSLCLRYDNCNEDFLIQISDLKSRWCEKSEQSELDVNEALPLCESLVNDSPLILLALTVFVLHLISHLGEDPEFFHHLPEDEMQVFKVGDNFKNAKNEPLNEDIQSPGKGGHQIIYTDCPDCQKTHEIKLPNPVNLEECPCKAPDESEIIKRLLPKLKLCKACKKKVRDFTVTSKSAARSPDSNYVPSGACDLCGQEH